MTAADRQDTLVEDYLHIEDPRERFQWIVESAARGREVMPEEERTDQNRVPGCTTRVWLSVSPGEGGTLAVRIESESPALQGIATLFEKIYSGAPPAEILATEPDFLERLGLDRFLTPTRLRGLRRLREKIVAEASVHRAFPGA